MTNDLLCGLKLLKVINYHWQLLGIFIMKQVSLSRDLERQNIFKKLKIIFLMNYMQFLLKNYIFQSKNDKICVVLKVKRLLKQHQVIYRELSYFKNKKTKIGNISHVCWRTGCELCASYWWFHSNIFFLFNLLIKLF